MLLELNVRWLFGSLYISNVVIIYEHIYEQIILHEM